MFFLKRTVVGCYVGLFRLHWLNGSSNFAAIAACGTRVQQTGSA